MKFSKRLLSMVAAGALVLSATMSAFAAQTEISATYEEIEINVVASDTGTVTINPYGLPVTVGTTSFTGMQFVSTPMTIQNLSVADLEIEAEVTTTTGRGSSMTFVNTAVDPDQTEKQVQVDLQVKKADGLTSVAEADVLPVLSAWDKGTAGDINATLSVDAPVKTAGSLTLLKSANPNDATPAPVDGGVAVFRLNGTCSKNPEDPWKTSDTFTAKVVFTFSPA